MNDTTEQNELHLPGYTLSTRLGAGGYGEVWLAHAPGGLTKAVKFIFGSFHEKRAEHELKALQRMKDLRHPFLLSLERIEIVDGRLVIVTELAEGSLKDRFDECIATGLRGIPRDELLRYLEDAADALDFLSEKHSLQHLDVKPENLLLVAGHVKVADFGLVKDIGNTQASMVGGLTPLYSAPEVFQGDPSARSDQYSLAVLYQEMLTGVLPFPGTTAAELTLQHLQEEPDLSPSPVADRYVLSRALAKDPANRFESCSEFVKALSAAATGEWGTQPSEARDTRGFDPILPERRADRRPGPVTEFFDEKIAEPRQSISSSMLLDWQPPADTPPRELPAIDLSSAEPAAQSTLVIGIGGTAAAVLKHFRLLLSKHFGEEPLPAVQLLLLDSDPKAIALAMQGDPRGALKPEETLALPLRRPQDYRDQSARLMRWLSRRWLYNIPKSLRTEGLRPLGRLAFADHARQAVQRIRMSLARAMAPESIAESTERSTLPFQASPPRVYLVASISGGVGSGMSLDVACAVRTALDKAGATGAQVHGVFLHNAGADSRQCDLARVNTFAWLTEFNHFHRPGSTFPGDESCGLPPLPTGRRALDAAYLVNLGAEVESNAVDQAARSIAEYLYLDALTPAQGFFEQCRQHTNPHSGEAPLRTFMLRKIGAAPDGAIDDAAALIAREVMLRWSCSSEAGPTSAAGLSDTNQLVQGAATLVGQLQLKLEGLASNARQLIEGQFGGDQQAFIDNLMQLAPGGSAEAAEMVRLVDCVFAKPKDQPEGHYILQRPLEGIVSPLAMKLAGDLGRWVLHKLDDRRDRLVGAQGAAGWLIDHLTKLDSDATRLGAALSRQISAAADQIARSTTGREASELAANYFRMRTDQQAVLASSLISRRLLAELKSVSETLSEFGRHLKHLAATMPQPQQSLTSGPFAAVPRQDFATLVDSVDECVQLEVIQPGGGLFQTVMGNARVRAQMISELSKRSQHAAAQLAARADVVQSNVATSASASMRTNGPTVPPMLGHGGAYRSLAVLPGPVNTGSSALVARELGPNASILPAVGHDIILCQEAWDLPLSSIAMGIIERRRDYADFAARVHTRSDIAWTPLGAPAAALAAPAADAFAAAMPTMTKVL